MITPSPMTGQLGSGRDDDRRVLVVGAGVAGLTLAQLLRAGGQHPVVVDSAPEGGTAGYMLGLFPFVEPVLRRLGVEGLYLERSVGMHRYRLRGSTGRQVREYSLDPAIEPFGHCRGIARGALLDVIADADCAVTFDTTVISLDQGGDRVRVVLDTGGHQQEAVFDAVVGADGTHSGIRDLVFPPDDIGRVDTQWGGWVSWSAGDDDPDLYEETWGDGFFVGLYPVPGRTGVFLGGPRTATASGPAEFIAGVRQRLSSLDARHERALDAVAVDPSAYYWSMADVRSPRWVTGRVALVGDAAAGFLPTAGVGAAMAMESAAVLVDQLAGVGNDTVPQALGAYVSTQRSRVESAQDNSRQLARLMFREGRLLTRARDVGARFVSLDRALGPILSLLRDRPVVPRR